MRVIRADVLGMCFGVRDALRAISQIENPERVTIHGELVHNGEVLERLASRGFRMVDEDRRDSAPSTPEVLITAHGVSDRERARLEKHGSRLIDTTCPLVKRAHEAALTLRDEGYFVIVVGRRDHVEVIGIVEDLSEYVVVADESEITHYDRERIGMVFQTTTSERAAERAWSAAIRLNPESDLRRIDTVCLPTKEHQRALHRLLGEVEAVVVVGGHQSNNTKELVKLCRERGMPCLHVSKADELDVPWLERFGTVGLTAGTSTLDETIDEVQRVLSLIETVDSSRIPVAY